VRGDSAAVWVAIAELAARTEEQREVRPREFAYLTSIAERIRYGEVLRRGCEILASVMGAA
jgi:hypothetical protein